MLAEFKVRNFKNFRDELHFSLESRKNYEYNQSAVQNGIIKDAVVLGYNASGKTNLGQAVMDIIFHLTDKKMKKRFQLFYSNLYHPDDVVSFAYKFKFGASTLEYTYEKLSEEQVLRECLWIDGKKKIVNDADTCSVSLNGSESLNLDHWDRSISLVKYVYANTMLNKEDKDCQTFLRFMHFVNQMLLFSSTEGLRVLGSALDGRDLLEEICNMECGVESLQAFLEEMGIPFRLKAEDKGEGKKIYCQMGGREAAFAPLMSSGTRSLVFLFLWYMQRERLSFIFIDEFDAFYHTDLAMAVIRKLMMEKEIQVVFTSHNTDIITNELLRPDCYFLLEDNRIRSFSDLTDKALREAHNLQKMYKAGAFHEK